MAEVDVLVAHLADTYGFFAKTVFRFHDDVTLVRDRDGTGWIARTFGPARARSAVEGDAAVLAWLEDRHYPAERLIDADPVSSLAEETVLLTRWVPGVPRARRRQTIKDAGGMRGLGALLARLHALELDSEAANRAGGAWHHIADGGPAAELSAARAWLERARGVAGVRELPHFAVLEDALDALDDCSGLPEALVHPDFVLANVVAAEGPSMVLVDWAGTGRGPRLWSLAFALWAAGSRDLRRVDLLVEGYRRDLQLDDAEIARLSGAIAARPLVFDIWHLHHHNRAAADAAAAAAHDADLAVQIAERARAGFRACDGGGEAA